MDDVEDLDEDPPRRRASRRNEFAEQDDALTHDQVMRARGYVFDPSTGRWA